MPIKISQNKIIFNDNSEMTTAPSVQAAFPTGTVAIFQQTSAPTGWTKLTTYNDYALRLVNGTVSAYTSGLAFTSAFANRSVTGSVSVSVSDHTSTNTGSSTTGISVASTAVGGTYSGNTNASTLSFSGTSGNSTATSGTTSSSTITISGTTQTSANGINVHQHAYNYPTLNTGQQTLSYNEGGTYVTVYTDVSLSTASGYTSYDGDGSSHDHTVNYSGGNHSHDFTVPGHTHGFTANNTGSHSHPYSGSFTSTSHGHSVTDNGHSHSIPTLTHSASGTFYGDSINFSVNYVDVILASKN